MRLQSFRNLLVEELRDIYDAEGQLVEALPKMAEGAVLPELKQAFMRHLEETEKHVERLESAFLLLNEPATEHRCQTMTGLIGECAEVLREDKKADPGVLEAALICAAQKVEHFEIAAYGCARTYAQMLGLNQVAELLQKTLDEEGNANKILNEIAMQSVNPEAAEATREDKNLREAVVAVLEVTH